MRASLTRPCASTGVKAWSVPEMLDPPETANVGQGAHRLGRVGVNIGHAGIAAAHQEDRVHPALSHRAQGARHVLDRVRHRGPFPSLDRAELEHAEGGRGFTMHTPAMRGSRAPTWKA